MTAKIGNDFPEVKVDDAARREIADQVLEAMRRQWEAEKKSRRKFKMPRDPAAFWRAYERVQRQHARAVNILEYLADHCASRAELKTAIERVARTSRRSNTFDAECSARLCQAKSAGTLPMFLGPRIAKRSRDRFSRVVPEVAEGECYGAFSPARHRADPRSCFNNKCART
jgi:hypothetical protein